MTTKVKELKITQKLVTKYIEEIRGVLDIKSESELKRPILTISENDLMLVSFCNNKRVAVDLSESSGRRRIYSIYDRYPLPIVAKKTSLEIDGGTIYVHEFFMAVRPNDNHVDEDLYSIVLSTNSEQFYDMDFDGNIKKRQIKKASYGYRHPISLLLSSDCFEDVNAPIKRICNYKDVAIDAPITPESAINVQLALYNADVSYIQKELAKPKEKRLIAAAERKDFENKTILIGFKGTASTLVYADKGNMFALVANYFASTAIDSTYRDIEMVPSQEDQDHLNKILEKNDRFVNCADRVAKSLVKFTIIDGDYYGLIYQNNTYRYGEGLYVLSSFMKSEIVDGNLEFKVYEISTFGNIWKMTDRNASAVTDGSELLDEESLNVVRSIDKIKYVESTLDIIKNKKFAPILNILLTKGNNPIEKLAKSKFEHVIDRFTKNASQNTTVQTQLNQFFGKLDYNAKSIHNMIGLNAFQVDLLGELIMPTTYSIPVALKILFKGDLLTDAQLQTRLRNGSYKAKANEPYISIQDIDNETFERNYRLVKELFDTTLMMTDGMWETSYSLIMDLVTSINASVSVKKYTKVLTYAKELILGKNGFDASFLSTYGNSSILRYYTYLSAVKNLILNRNSSIEAMKEINEEDIANGDEITYTEEKIQTFSDAIDNLDLTPETPELLEDRISLVNLLSQDLTSSNFEKAFQRLYKNSWQYLEQEDDKYAFVMPKSSYQIAQEGADQSHCVARYIPTIAEGKTQVGFIRRKETPDQALYTIEFTKNGVINQIRGKFNSEPAPDARVFAEKVLRVLKK